MKRFILFSFMIMFALSSVAYAEIGTEVNLSYIETYCVPGLGINDLHDENHGSVIFCDTDTESDGDDKYFVCENESQFVHIKEDNVCKRDDDNWYAIGYYRCDDRGHGRGYAWYGKDEKDGCCNGVCYKYANNLYVNESGVYSELCNSGKEISRCEADESIVENADVTVEVEIAPVEDTGTPTPEVVAAGTGNSSATASGAYADEGYTAICVEGQKLEDGDLKAGVDYIRCVNDDSGYKYFECSKNGQLISLIDETACEGFAYPGAEDRQFSDMKAGYHLCIAGNDDHNPMWMAIPVIERKKCKKNDDRPCYKYSISGKDVYINGPLNDIGSWYAYSELEDEDWVECVDPERKVESAAAKVAADTGKLSATAGGETKEKVADTGNSLARASGATATTEEVLKHEDYEKILKELKGYKLLDRSVWKTEDGKFNTARLMVDVGSGAVLGTVGGVIANTVIRKNQISSEMGGYQCHINGQVVADYGDEFVVDIYK